MKPIVFVLRAGIRVRSALFIWKKNIFYCNSFISLLGFTKVHLSVDVLCITLVILMYCSMILNVYTKLQESMAREYSLKPSNVVRRQDMFMMVPGYVFDFHAP